jgi:ABC-type nitrate/sulfonate/bicarbonate transport system substrate-binding protein
MKHSETTPQNRARPIFVCALLALLALLALAGCSPGGGQVGGETGGGAAAGTDASETASDAEGGGELFTLRVTDQTTTFNEVVVADRMGFFEDEGIRLEYVGGLPQGVTEFQLLGQGEVDAFVSAHITSIGQARIAGVKAVSVGPGSRDTEEYPHMHYLVLEDSDIQSLDDLLGKKIGVGSPNGACMNGFIDYYLAQRYPDYTPDQVEYVPLGNNVESALFQGGIDMTTSHNPTAGQVLAAGGVREVGTSHDILLQEGFSLAGRGFTEEFIAEYPEVVQGFVNALYRSRLWINGHLDEALKVVADVMGTDPENLTGSKVVFDEKKNNNLADITRWVEFGEAVGNWGAGQIDPEELFTLEFVPEDPPASDADLTWEDRKSRSQ